jgi:hypothetical protein
MRLFRIIPAALLIAAVAGTNSAWSLSITDGGALNSGPAPRVASPDDKAHLAGSGSSMSPPAGDPALTSSGTGSAAPSGQPATRWSDSWFSHTIIIGDGWKYPPSAP